MASLDSEIAKVQESRKKMEKELVSFTSLKYDTELYGAIRPEDYVQSIPVDDEEENGDAMDNVVARKLASYTAPKSMMKEMLAVGGDADDVAFRKRAKIIDREDDYRRRRLRRDISPERHDPFAMGGKTPDPKSRTYAEVMKEEMLKREREETLRAIAKKRKEEEEEQKKRQKREKSEEGKQQCHGKAKRAKCSSDWDMLGSDPGVGRWDASPTSRRADASSRRRRSRWDESRPVALSHGATPVGAVDGGTPAAHESV